MAAMAETLFLFIYILALYAGFLLPIPSIGLAWREWTKTRKVPPLRKWRRTMSWVGLLLFNIGLAFAVFLAVAEGRGVLDEQSYYDSWMMYVGVFGTIASIAISALSERGLRRYLLLGTIGLLCFFCFGLTEKM